MIGYTLVLKGRATFETRTTRRVFTFWVKIDWLKTVQIALVIDLNIALRDLEY